MPTSIIPLSNIKPLTATISVEKSNEEPENENRISTIIYVKPIHENHEHEPITIEDTEPKIIQTPPLSNSSNMTNEDLLGYGALVFLFLNIATLLIPIVFVAQFGLQMVDMIKMLIFVIYNTCTIGLPFLFFWQKPRRLDSILEFIQ